MNVKTLIIRAAVTPFFAVGGAGAGQIFSATHPAAMPYAAAMGCLLALILCYFMYWRVEC